MIKKISMILVYLFTIITEIMKLFRLLITHLIVIDFPMFHSVILQLPAILKLPSR